VQNRHGRARAEGIDAEIFCGTNNWDDGMECGRPCVRRLLVKTLFFQQYFPFLFDCLKIARDIAGRA
jgi:hypothetical protein